jgi:hypothetical protein
VAHFASNSTVRLTLRHIAWTAIFTLLQCIFVARHMEEVQKVEYPTQQRRKLRYWFQLCWNPYALLAKCIVYIAEYSCSSKQDQGSDLF